MHLGLWAGWLANIVVQVVYGAGPHDGLLLVGLQVLQSALALL